MTTQPDLFSAPPFHAGDPDTSREAAASAAVTADAHRERIALYLLRVGDHGATAYEAYVATGGARPHVAGTRLGELEHPKHGLALVEKTARRRPTDTGRPAVVYVLTDAGRQWARELREVARHAA